MTDTFDEQGRARARVVPSRPSAVLTKALGAAGRPLLFGLRLWASVCLALYVAFWLELDNPFWAGTSAAFMCLPRLGASLRKGWHLMIGTSVGAVVIVVLVACFPQDRAALLASLALWGAVCALAATVLRNFASYAAALAGYTAVIIASDGFGATGGLAGQVFMLAITRVSEICIGIVCAGIVLAGTDLGGAPRRLAASFAALSSEIMDGFTKTLALAGPESPVMRPVRRALIRRVIALDAVIDEAIGESSQLRYHSPVLQTAVDGLFAALASWRIVEACLARSSDDKAWQKADAILRCLPQELRSTRKLSEPAHWLADPTRLHRISNAAARTLIALPADTPSLRLLGDQTARVLAGMSHVLDGLALLVGDPARLPSRHRGVRLHVPDWLPSLVNAARAFVMIGAAELFWIVTAWPSGTLVITFTAIVVLLFSPIADQAYARAMDFIVGGGLAIVFASIIAFAVLPGLETFAALSIVMGLYLVPAGALMAQPWQTATFTAMAFLFVPLLSPTNQMSYDPGRFYNSALAIIAGIGAAALSFRLLPSLSPALRTRRLLALTLRDLRRLATRSIPPTLDDWEGRVYSRLSVLPDAAEPLQRAQLLAALSVGVQTIQLRRIVPPLGLGPDLDTALEALAQGNGALATARLARLDHLLASRPGAGPEASVALRARSSILAISEALTQYAAYFDAGGSDEVRRD